MRRFFACLVFLAVFPGCGGPRGSVPPKVRLGQEACAECHMIIEDERFCGALFGEDSVYLKFDDIGCMKLFENSRRLGARPGWVRDFVSRAWLKKEEAYYVQSAQTPTPMGSGAAAFKDRAAAESFSAKAGTPVLSWENLKGEGR